MASLRRRANSNSLLYRVKDPEGREQQRSVCLGPCESLQDGLAYFLRLVDLHEAEAEAERSHYSRRSWIIADAERARDKAAERVDAIRRAMVELEGTLDA